MQLCLLYQPLGGVRGVSGHWLWVPWTGEVDGVQGHSGLWLDSRVTMHYSSRDGLDRSHPFSVRSVCMRQCGMLGSFRQQIGQTMHGFTRYMCMYGTL